MPAHSGPVASPSAGPAPGGSWVSATKTVLSDVEPWPTAGGRTVSRPRLGARPVLRLRPGTVVGGL